MGRAVRAAAAAVLTLGLAGCGGSPSGPTDPTATVIVVVFYDENANGLLDGGEVVRIPGVTVLLAGDSAVTAASTGQAGFTDIPAGFHQVAIESQTLPPFYVLVMPAVTVTVTQAAAEVHFPVTLPIGGNRPNTYMAFGDSITDGAGHTDGLAYRGMLQSLLQDHFGRAEVINQGAGSTTSQEGAETIAAALAAVRPAYTLIHLGTNDFNKSGCRRIQTLDECFTVPSLRTIVRETRAVGSLPCLATIIPCNTGFNDRAPPQRNEWVHLQDERIRILAQEEGALLVDLEPLFLQAGPLDTLFEDHVHPNERGFELMAEGLFEAIAHGETPAAFAPAESGLGFGLWDPPGARPGLHGWSSRERGTGFPKRGPSFPPRRGL